MLVNFPDHWRKSGQITFNKQELGQIISLYGRYVAKGTWRDYALDCNKDMARFSIFKNAAEHPLYTISKTVHRQGQKKTVRYAILQGEKQLKQGQSLLEVLIIFEEDHLNK